MIKKTSRPSALTTMTDTEEHMDSRKLVIKQTAVVTIGQVLCLALMFGVYALLGYFSYKVLFGGIIGAVAAIGNFFFMALLACMAADKAQQQDVAGGQKLLRASYPVRLIVLAVILFACAKSGYFDVLALVLPLAFVRPVLTVAEFFKKER